MTGAAELGRFARRKGFGCIPYHDVSLAVLLNGCGLREHFAAVGEYVDGWIAENTERVNRQMKRFEFKCTTHKTYKTYYLCNHVLEGAAVFQADHVEAKCEKCSKDDYPDMISWCMACLRESWTTLDAQIVKQLGEVQSEKI